MYCAEWNNSNGQHRARLLHTRPPYSSLIMLLQVNSQNHRHFTNRSEKRVKAVRVATANELHK